MIEINGEVIPDIVSNERFIEILKIHNHIVTDVSIQRYHRIFTYLGKVRRFKLLQSQHICLALLDAWSEESNILIGEHPYD